MIPRPKTAAQELRDILTSLRAVDDWARESESGLKALDALLSKRAEPPSGTPAMVVTFIATARQLAAAVDGNHVNDNNRAQARNLGVKGRAVANAVANWTDGGRREPMSVVGAKEES